MKTLEQQMAFYAAYHRNRWNRLTHFVAPIFLVAEVAFALGMRHDTRLEVERLSHPHD